MSILSLAPDKQNYNHFFSETQLVEGVCKHRIGNRTFSPKVGPWSSNISLTTVVNAIWWSNSGLFLTTLFESRIYSMDLNFDFITLIFHKTKCTLIEAWFFKFLICNRSSKNSNVHLYSMMINFYKDNICIYQLSFIGDYNKFGWSPQLLCDIWLLGVWYQLPLHWISVCMQGLHEIW